MFQLAVDQNETVKLLLAEIDWDFKAFQQLQEKVYKTIEKVTEGVKAMRLC